MRKIICIILSIFLVGGIVKYTYISNKCKNINYAVNRYFTTGIFNEYKLYNVGKVNLSFSNGNVAFVKIDGMSKKPPHRKVGYSVFLEKNNKGIWKVKKVYPAEITMQQVQ